MKIKHLPELETRRVEPLKEVALPVFDLILKLGDGRGQWGIDVDNKGVIVSLHNAKKSEGVGHFSQKGERVRVDVGINRRSTSINKY